MWGGEWRGGRLGREEGVMEGARGRCGALEVEAAAEQVEVEVEAEAKEVEELEEEGVGRG